MPLEISCRASSGNQQFGEAGGFRHSGKAGDVVARQEAGKKAVHSETDNGGLGKRKSGTCLLCGYVSVIGFKP